MSEQITLIPPTPLTAEDRLVETHDLLPLARAGAVVNPTRQFLDSVARFGILTPITLLKLNGGPYHIADGRRRIIAAAEAAIAQIPARVYQGEGALGAVLTLVLHEQRRANVAAEVAAIERLLRDGASEREVCAATGLPIGRVRARMKLVGMHPELRAAFATGKIGAGVAERIARLPLPTQEQLLDPLREHGVVTAKDVSAVTHIQREEAVAALPADLFAPEADTPGPEPAAEVLASLRDAVRTALDILTRDEQLATRRSVARAITLLRTALPPSEQEVS